MGITKTEGFNDNTTEMSEVFKALGHPARLFIMKYLANQSRCITNDIVLELPLSQPTISKHLSELKKVNLIQGTVAGKNMCYCINQEGWEKTVNEINNISIAMNNGLKCC